MTPETPTGPVSASIRSMSAVLACLVIAGCGEAPADRAHPKTHRTAGLVFDYPGNWSINEPMPTKDQAFVMIESPGHALAILQCAPKELLPSLDGRAKEFSAMAEGEMPMGELVSEAPQAEPDAHGYRWLSQRFRVRLLGQTVPHRRLYGSKDLGDRSVLLIFQVSDEDAPRAMPGFELIRDSLRTEPSRP